MLIFFIVSCLEQEATSKEGIPLFFPGYDLSVLFFDSQNLEIPNQKYPVFINTSYRN